MRFERPSTVPLSALDAPRYSPNGVRIERPFTAPLPFSEEPLIVVREEQLLELSESQIERSIDARSRADSLQIAANDEPPIAARSQEQGAFSAEIDSQQQIQSEDLTRASAPVQDVTPPTLEQTFAADAAALREYYTIEEVLAVGGSSIIYRARSARPQLTSISSAIALKVLRPELRDNASAIARMHREFLFTAELIHPYIPRVYVIEQLSDILLINMELLTGCSLANALDTSQLQSLPVTEALKILRGCASALACAHEHGIVHGDFKPGNLWLTSTQQVRVIDFGAAHASRTIIGFDGNEILETPMPGVATPAYASPQILSGAPPTPRDDVFSLACVAYELLMGRAALANMDAEERDAAITSLAHPANISLRTWHALRRGLQPQREQRTATVQTLMAEIENSFAYEIVGQEIAKAKIAVEESIQARAAKTDTVARSIPLTIQPLVTGVKHNLKQLSQVAASRAVRAARMIRTFVKNTTGAAAKQADGIKIASATLLRQQRESWRSLATKNVPTKLGQAALVGVMAMVVAIVYFQRDFEVSFPAVASNAMPVLQEDIPPAPSPIARAAAAELVDESLTLSDLNWRQNLSASLQSIASVFERETVPVIPQRVFATALPRNSAIANTDRSRATVFIAKPKPSVSFERASINVSEQAVAAVVMVTRAGSTRSPMSVKWRTTSGSAKHGADYQGETSGTVRFANNQAVSALYVPLRPNSAANGNRTFEVELAKASNGNELGKITRAVITIQKSE